MRNQRLKPIGPCCVVSRCDFPSPKISLCQGVRPMINAVGVAGARMSAAMSPRMRPSHALRRPQHALAIVITFVAGAMLDLASGGGGSPPSSPLADPELATDNEETHEELLRQLCQAQAGAAGGGHADSREGGGGGGGSDGWGWGMEAGTSSLLSAFAAGLVGAAVGVILVQSLDGLARRVPAAAVAVGVAATSVPAALERATGEVGEVKAFKDFKSLQKASAGDTRTAPVSDSSPKCPFGFTAAPAVAAAGDSAESAEDEDDDRPPIIKAGLMSAGTVSPSLSMLSSGAMKCPMFGSMMGGKSASNLPLPVISGSFRSHRLLALAGGAQSGNGLTPGLTPDGVPRTILLTGASRGIGHGTVKMFAAA